MAFPTSVLADIAAGVPGELALEGAIRAQPVRLNTTDAANNVFGRALRVKGNAAAQDSTNVVVEAGGTGVFAGILANPKEHANWGAALNALAPNFAVPNGTIASAVLSAPGIFALVSNVANIGDRVYSLNADGTLIAAAPSAAAPANSTLIPGAYVARFPDADGGLVVIALIDAPTLLPDAT